MKQWSTPVRLFCFSERNKKIYERNFFFYLVLYYVRLDLPFYIVLTKEYFTFSSYLINCSSKWMTCFVETDLHPKFSVFCIYVYIGIVWFWEKIVNNCSSNSLLGLSLNEMLPVNFFWYFYNYLLSWLKFRYIYLNFPRRITTFDKHPRIGNTYQIYVVTLNVFKIIMLRIFIIITG